MSEYTTGELAKLCDVSVRTVQFYDVKDLLKPAELTEGGRRLYTDDDLKRPAPDLPAEIPGTLAGFHQGDS